MDGKGGTEDEGCETKYLERGARSRPVRGDQAEGSNQDIKSIKYISFKKTEENILPDGV